MIKCYYDEMAWSMDQEIQRLVKEAERIAMEILTQKRHVLDPLAEALMKEDVLEKAEIDWHCLDRCSVS